MCLYLAEQTAPLKEIKRPNVDVATFSKIQAKMLHQHDGYAISAVNLAYLKFEKACHSNKIRKKGNIKVNLGEKKNSNAIFTCFFCIVFLSISCLTEVL